MQISAIDDDQKLFVSPIVNDWEMIQEMQIHLIIDLEGGLDHGVSTFPGSVIYVYFPILDDPPPDIDQLEAISAMGAKMIRHGHRVLSHCGMGLNRSALMAGFILLHLGWDGERAVQRLRERRPGALFNPQFFELLRHQRSLCPAG